MIGSSTTICRSDAGWSTSQAFGYDFLTLCLTQTSIYVFSIYQYTTVTVTVGLIKKNGERTVDSIF